MKKQWLKIGILAFWLSWPALWFYLRWSRRTRVIIIAEDHVLMMKGWLGSGEWILPGGGLHKNEDVIVGAIRELREETSLELASSQLKVVGEGLGREHGLKFHYVVLSASLPARLPFKIQQQEVSEIAWLPLEKIGDFPISPLSRELLTTWTKF